MLSICYDPTAPASGEPSRQPEHQKLGEDMLAAGHLRGGAGLAGLEEYGKRIRHQNGEVFVSNGPFTETREALGGYFLVECSEAEALEYARRIPTDSRSWVEVRRVFLTQDEATARVQFHLS
jgi:hypothetical protein